MSNIYNDIKRYRYISKTEVEAIKIDNSRVGVRDCLHFIGVSADIDEISKIYNDGYFIGLDSCKGYVRCKLGKYYIVKFPKGDIRYIHEYIFNRCFIEI